MKITMTIAISLLITCACASGTNSNDPTTSSSETSDPNAGPFSFTSPDGENHTYYTWESFPIVVQPLDGSQKEAAAVQDFNDVFGTEIFVLADSDYDISTCFNETESYEEEPAGNTQRYLQNNYISSANVKISTYIIGTLYFYGLFQHELGHTLGFIGWHSTGSTSALMYQYIEGSGAQFICNDSEFLDWMLEAYGLEANCPIP